MPRRCRKDPRASIHQAVGALALCLLVTLLCGCASGARTHGAPRAFDFQTDTFAYPNQLVWEYSGATNGQCRTHHREPKPSYALHCFVLARSAVQFYQHARFEPQAQAPDQGTYRRLVRRVVSSSPRKAATDSERIVIPGYADLRQFSAARESLLKAECGSSWQSYFQRGNWRMVFPFSRRHQQRLAQRLLDGTREGKPLIVHLVRFPQLSINHAVVVFDARESAQGITFSIYDPNLPDAPARLEYDRASRRFLLPANSYFAGGRVDVYEIYHRWNY